MTAAAAVWYNFYTMPEFEFDPQKSASNQGKHGIDFVGAQALWQDPGLLEIPLATEDEPRTLVIGTIEGRHWSAIITHRDDRIRIISVRRSRIEERELYES